MHVAVGTDVIILASAVIVLGGLSALVRAIVRFRDDVRDNTRATGQLTRRLDEFAPAVDGRLARVERLLVLVWDRLFHGEPPPPP